MTKHTEISKNNIPPIKTKTSHHSTMKRLLFLLLTLFAIDSMAQRETYYPQRADDNGFFEMKWTSLVAHLEDDYFLTPDALRVGDNVLLFQLKSGGWGKNNNMQRILSEDEHDTALAAQAHVDEGTIDNGATSTEIIFLARLYKATGEKRFLKGVTRGLDYLLKMQYKNGGFPQCYPRTTGYVTEIEYNDNANVNVLRLMRAVYESDPRCKTHWDDWATWTQPGSMDRRTFDFLPRKYFRKAKKSFDKGISCILRTQIVRDGQLTVWCAQYDHQTLQPAKARAYELVSLSGAESFGILELLLTLSSPSDAVIKAVEGGALWAESSKVEGLKFDYFRTPDGKRDYRMAPCDDCPPLWARFYDIDTNEPFFCDRDGVKVDAVEKIGIERRTGYSWYSGDGNQFLKHYEKWKKRVSSVKH